MKTFVLLLVLVAACAAEIEKREADPGYGVTSYRGHHSHGIGYSLGHRTYGKSHAGHFARGYSYRHKRSADPEPEADPEPAADLEPTADPHYAFVTPYYTHYNTYTPVYYYRPRTTSYSYVHQIHKREASPEPEPQPEAEPSYGYGRYTPRLYTPYHGSSRSHVRVSTPHAIYGHGISRGYGGHSLWKREANPEPEPEPQPEAEPSYGHGYYSSRLYSPYHGSSRSHVRVSTPYASYGHGVSQGYGIVRRGYGHSVWKRDANPEPEPEPEAHKSSVYSSRSHHGSPHYSRATSYVAPTTFGYPTKSYSHRLHKREASPDPEPGYSYRGFPRATSYVGPTTFGYPSSSYRSAYRPASYRTYW